jgi:two-component system nitrate/nitrite response regulator NarL
MKFSRPTIRIVLADDHKLILQAYSSLLGDISHFHVVGSACNGQEALDLLGRTHTDVLLLDANMPVMNGYETLKAIRKTKSQVKVIMLTMHTEPAFISSYLSNGANAFLGKNCEWQELVRAIQSVMEDGYYFSSTVSKTMISDTLRDPELSESYGQLRLTERETDILKLVCEDLSNDDIAKKLKISAHTIKFFRKNIYKKTNTHTTIGLIKYAIKHGLFAVG